MKKTPFVFIALLCAGIVCAGESELAKAKKNGTKALFKYAQKLEKSKKYEEAIEVYYDIIASEKNIAVIQDARIKSSKAKARSKDYGGAIHDLQNVLAMKEKYPKTRLSYYQTAIMDLAHIYSSRMGNYAGAIELLDNAMADKGFAFAKKRFQQKKESLLQEQVKKLAAIRKFDEARKLAAENLKKMPGKTSIASMINTETAYGKWLTSRKKFAEADQVLRAAAKLQGAAAVHYWRIQEAVVQNQTSKRNWTETKKELEKLKKMPGAPRTGIVLAESRVLNAFGKNHELVQLYVQAANDPKYTRRERGFFYADAAFYAVSKLKNIKLSEEYYAKAKALIGKKYRNARVEKSLTYWRGKL